MAKLYSNNSIENARHLNPKKETIDFIINFSKSYKVLGEGNKKHDVFLN